MFFNVSRGFSMKPKDIFSLLMGGVYILLLIATAFLVRLGFYAKDKGLSFTSAEAFSGYLSWFVFAIILSVLIHWLRGK